MATTENAAVRPADTQEVLQPSSKESIVVEAPKQQAEPSTEQSDAEKYRLLSDKLGNQLGETRKELKALRDQMEQMNTLQQVPEARPTFEQDPEAFIQMAVRDAIGQGVAPTLEVLQSDLVMRKGEAFDQKLSETYPDWKETANSEDFANWVQANEARMQMYKIADQNYDTESAAELIKRFRQDSAQAEKDKQGAIAAAGLVSGGGDTGGARMYAASEVKRMMNDDPESYRRWLANDGMKAYQEGRVDQSR